MSRRNGPTKLTPFYGYSAERIAEWCCVSVATAIKYKQGQRKPSCRVMRLFELHRDWREFRCVKGELWDSAGYSVRPSHFQMVGLLWQALSEADNKAYRELLDRMAAA